jgi:hypothetical protein
MGILSHGMLTEVVLNVQNSHFLRDLGESLYVCT